MNYPSLQNQLRQYGRRVRAVGGASGLGWGVFVTGVVALAAAWADLLLELAPWHRRFAIGIAIFAGAAFAIAMWRRSSQRANPRILSRRLDQIAGAEGQIVAGVDLIESPRELGPLETGLAGIAVQRAAELTRNLPGKQIASARPILIGALASGSLICLVGVVFLLNARLVSTLWLRFSDPFGDHPPYSAIVLQVAPGDIKVIYGQGIEIRATVEGATNDRLELLLEPIGAAQERLPMFPEGEGRWRAAVADVTLSGRYTVRSGRARSPRYRIDVVTVPRIASVRFRVTQPAYTRQAAYEGPAPDGLAGLPGARVEVWAASNRPLSEGMLRVIGTKGGVDSKLTRVSSDGKEVHGAFEVDSDGKIEIQVRDVEGQQSLEAYSTSVVLLQDERPLVRLIEPRETSFATPDAPLPVVIAAEDDYGISRIQLFRSLNGSRVLPTELLVGGQNPNRWNEQVYLPLSEYGLRPGDEVKLFARVEDNDPAGAKGSESSVVTVRIIPRELFDRLTATREGMETLAAKYREAERRMEALANEMERLRAELEKLPADSPLAKAEREKLEKLARQLRDEAKSIQESARHPLPIDVDKNLSRELESLASLLAGLAGETEKLAANPSLKNGATNRSLAELRNKLAAGRKEFGEKAMEPLEHLGKIYPLLEDQARFVQLYLRQRDLANRLQTLKGRDKADTSATKARMRDLEAEQSQIRVALASLLADIEDHTRLLPDDPRLAELRKTAQDFVLAVRASGASEAMTECETALAAFDGNRAASASKNAADILERFVAQCNGEGGIGAQCEAALKFKPSLSACLGNSISQMLGNPGLPKTGNGNGPGMGSGDGFSARQNNLENVGLYGTQPTLVSSARQGTGSSAAGSAPGKLGGPQGDQKISEMLTSKRGLKSAGQAQAQIPGRYQRRVADYFQRIADETGPR